MSEEEQKEQIREYVLNRYNKGFFKKKEIIRDSKGKIMRRIFHDIEPIINVFEKHIEVKNHIDGSPIILGKGILK